MDEVTLSNLLAKQELQSKGCEEKCLDFQALKFEAADGDLRLYNDFQSYYFKRDPKNPKDPKVVHALRQFCKMMKVPYSFFVKNPEYMKNDMVSCWLPTLKTDKAQVLGKLRRTKEEGKSIIRALLPVEYTNIPNMDIVKRISEVITDDFKIEFVFGDDRDDLVLHMRFISDQTFSVCGEDCTLGFSVVCSELGASPLCVDTMLYRMPSKTALIASYGGESFFSSPYEGIQPDDLNSLFPSLLTRLKEQLHFLKERVQAAKEVTEDRKEIKELMASLKGRKGLTEKFHQLLFLELEKDDSVKTLWDFSNKLAILAKDFDVKGRIQIEKVAGDLVGLWFEKC